MVTWNNKLSWFKEEKGTSRYELGWIAPARTLRKESSLFDLVKRIVAKLRAWSIFVQIKWKSNTAQMPGARGRRCNKHLTALSLVSNTDTAREMNRSCRELQGVQACGPCPGADGGQFRAKEEGMAGFPKFVSFQLYHGNLTKFWIWFNPAPQKAKYY